LKEKVGKKNFKFALHAAANPALPHGNERRPETGLDVAKRMNAMIQLIASDIDGTLLQKGEKTIPEEVFREIHRLRQKGILFCPASGRQYTSLRRLFAPVAEEVPFLCENGAIVYGVGSPGPVLSKTVMDREKALTLARAIQAHPDFEVLISGADTSYLLPKGPEILPLIRDRTGNNTVCLRRLEEMPEDILKVSCYSPKGTAWAESVFLPWPEGGFQAAVAGDRWLDFTVADKGAGLAGLCRGLDIPLENVMAFGDNYNDLPMLRLVGRPYLMENAAEALHGLVPSRCRRVADILRTL